MFFFYLSHIGTEKIPIVQSAAVAVIDTPTSIIDIYTCVYICIYHESCYKKTRNTKSIRAAYPFSLAQMTQAEPSLIYLKYKSLEDVLKVIVYSAQSAIGLTPMLYHIAYNNLQIIFIQTGGIGSSTIHYIMLNEKPTKKFIELKRLTGEYQFVDRIGTDTQSLYVPVLELENSTLKFP